MTTIATPPAPPALPGAAWRPLTSEHRAALAALAEAGRAADGGFMPLPADEYLLAGAPAIGAFSDSGQLLAYTAVRLNNTPSETLAAIIGQVHPAARGRGLGRYLMQWSVAKGRALLAHAAGQPGLPCVLRIATEGLTPAAERLYARFGFAQQFAEDVMRHELAALPDALLPAGVQLLAWAPERAEQFFAAYDASFRTRPGFPGWSAEQWIEWASDDDDFRAELSLLAMHGDTPVGFIVGGQGWVVQVGVRPEWRGRGLGAALVAEVLRRARAGGSTSMLLDVNVNNPGAARVYARLGFERIGRRARYVLQ